MENPKIIEVFQPVRRKSRTAKAIKVALKPGHQLRAFGQGQ